MMIENSMMLKDILDWYLWAGVDETVGDEPFAVSKAVPSFVDKHLPQVVKSIFKPI